MLRYLLGFTLLAFSLNIRGQSDSMQILFENVRAELQALQKPAFYSKTEQERFEANKKFLELWNRVVPHPLALQFDFQLKEVSVLTSPRKDVRLITWNVPKEDGTHLYFGFLLTEISTIRRKGLFRRETATEYRHHALLDRSATIKAPETHSGGPDRWFGMLYTEMIPCDGYYTLIGWDGNNKLTQRKFVDVLSFRPNGLPVFGRDVFRIPKKNPRRLMFEYSSEVVMSLKYDERSNRIVYSHLGSHKADPMLDGQYQYYGPDGSYDALVMRKDRWEVEEDIDARNPRSKNDNVRKPDPAKQTPVYKPR